MEAPAIEYGEKTVGHEEFAIAQYKGSLHDMILFKKIVSAYNGKSRILYYFGPY